MATESDHSSFLSRNQVRIFSVCMLVLLGFFSLSSFYCLLKPFRYTSILEEVTNEILQVQVFQSCGIDVLEGALQEAYFTLGR